MTLALSKLQRDVVLFLQRNKSVVICSHTVARFTSIFFCEENNPVDDYRGKVNYMVFCALRKKGMIATTGRKIKRNGNKIRGTAYELTEKRKKH